MGDKIKYLRKRKLMTQEDLSFVSGVSRPVIARLEKGQYKAIRIGTLCKIADALGVDISIFFDKSLDVSSIE